MNNLSACLFIAAFAVVLLTIAEKLIAYYVRYQRNVQSSMFECGWKPPLRCVAFEHQFRHTGLSAKLSPTIFSHLEQCKRCGLGRLATLAGFQYEKPSEMKLVLERSVAVEEGVAIPLAKPLKLSAVPNPSA